MFVCVLPPLGVGPELLELGLELAHPDLGLVPVGVGVLVRPGKLLAVVRQFPVEY